MKKSARIAGWVFLAIALTDVILLAAGNETLPVYIKPFLIPSLAAAALLSLLPEHKVRLTALLACGLLFHNVGDILLLFDGRNFLFFALGLGCFFIGHLFYLGVLSSGLGKAKNWKEICSLIAPFVIAPLAALAFNAGLPMTIALAVYSIALLLVAATGAIWIMRRRPFGWRVLAGGLLFMFSDLLIAIKVFSGIDFPLRHATVIATYLAAEWLLVSAMTRWIQKR
jgi:uncharacterized membrane protein YhhN